MLNIGILGFANPWLFAGLLALPGIWWLLKAVPPSPKHQPFPPLMIIRQIDELEEKPDRSPWWLLLLRMLIAALLIIALTGPLLNPREQIAGSGAITVILDDGWPAAQAFEQRRRTILSLAEQAKRDGRPIRLVRTAPIISGIDAQLFPPEELIEHLPGLSAKPWQVDHRAALAEIENTEPGGGYVWIRSDPVPDPEAATQLAVAVRQLGDLTIIGDQMEADLPWLSLPALSALGFDVTLRRAAARSAFVGSLLAVGSRGEPLARHPVRMARGEHEVSLTLSLPRELRNETARITLEHRSHGAQQVLLDERWRRRTVGLWGGRGLDDSQPLLNELNFVRKAAAPYAEIIEGPLLELVEKPMSLLILADHGAFDDAEATALATWVSDGGVLLRFAGPRLAASGGELLPVPIRDGARELGGAMSWLEPLRIDGFNPDGPFAGLVGHSDVLVRRQVLAEPSPELASATLAILEDGTPLMTGAKRGDGWLILVHTTANADWSNLALSGLFVDLIRRAIEIGPGAGGITRGMLTLSETVDAAGNLMVPEQAGSSIDAKDLDLATASDAVQPGLYGPVVTGSDGEQDLPRKAFNIQHGIDQLYAFPEIDGTDTELFRSGTEIDLARWFLFLAFVLLLADLLIAMVLRGILSVPGFARSGAKVSSIVLLGLGVVSSAQAQSQQAIDIERAIELTDQTRIGYVRTGIQEIDRVSEAGLYGLIDTLTMRTSIEAGPPVAVDIAVDPLDLFPLLYWPVTAQHPDINDEGRRRIAQYLRGGGLVLFDTKDAAFLFPGQDGGGPGERRLAELLDGMDIPPLELVPDHHVLTRSFYLIQDFPGRFAGQRIWVDRASSNVNDGVSGIVIGAHDWAGAWAIDPTGRPQFPVVPGGERQREFARRFGINLVMYAMTGNYKTDQVHIPALLERLGE